MIRALCLLAAAPTTAQLARSGAYNTQWLTPTVEDDPTYFKGGMPLGNGDTQVLAWANATAGGVSFYISKNDAMASDTSSYKVALITLALSPNPFLAGPFFNQSLAIDTATLHLTVGGPNASHAAAALSVWVDAASNTVWVRADSLSPAQQPAPLSFAAMLTPVRPRGYAPYRAPWHCTPGSSAPDVLTDPLPPAFPSPATLTVLHANDDADLASGPIVRATLAAQGLGDPAIVATVPELWRGRIFGAALDGAPGGAPACAAFARASPTLLQSAAPAPCALLRVAVLSTQRHATQSAWLGGIAAQLAATPVAPPRAAHEQFWARFWSRSFVDVTTPAPPAPPQPPAGNGSLPPNPLLWLRASSLRPAQPNSSRVASWASEGGSAAATLSQPNATRRPSFIEGALGKGMPGVLFSQRARTALVDAALPPLPRAATVFAVFKDQGSDGGARGPHPPACCSGVVSFAGAFYGVSALPGAGGGGGGVDDDALGPSDDAGGARPVATNVLGDFGGSNLLSPLNVAGRTVVVGVVYSSGGAATLTVDGCAQGSSALASAGAAAAGVAVGQRMDSDERFFEGALGEVLVYGRALSAEEAANATAYLAAQYGVPLLAACSAPAAEAGFKVSQTYAMSRYMNAVQARVVVPEGGAAQQPIKFNGLAWTSRRPGVVTACGGLPLGPDCREWGPDK